MPPGHAFLLTRLLPLTAIRHTGRHAEPWSLRYADYHMVTLAGCRPSALPLLYHITLVIGCFSWPVQYDHWLVITAWLANSHAINVFVTPPLPFNNGDATRYLVWSPIVISHMFALPRHYSSHINNFLLLFTLNISLPHGHIIIHWLSSSLCYAFTFITPRLRPLSPPIACFFSHAFLFTSRLLRQSIRLARHYRRAHHWLL